MYAYLLVHYTAKTTTFISADTFEQAKIYLNQLVSQSPLCLGDSVSIVKADTDQVVYFRSSTRLTTSLDMVRRVSSQLRLSMSTMLTCLFNPQTV